MWMDALCKRRALSFPKHTHSGRAKLLCFNHFDKILQQEEPLKQPIHNQNTAFTSDTNFCSCCHKYRYRSRRTISISRRLFISLTNSANPITLLIIFSLLTNSCYANAQSPPKTTAVTQTPGPGVPSSPYVSLDEEKYKTLETQPQSRTIPGAPYYEFFINEASYKFWAVFQLTTVFILLYSAFAAIYYAKYTFLTEIETLKDEDIILRRRRQLSSEAAQQIIKATASLSLPLEDRRLPNRGHR